MEQTLRRHFQASKVPSRLRTFLEPSTLPLKEGFEGRVEGTFDGPSLDTFAPSNPFQAFSKSPSAMKSWKPLKPPSSPLEAPFRSLQSPLKPSKVKLPSSLREGYLWRVLRWRWSPLRHWAEGTQMVRFVDGMGSMLTWFQIANWSPAMLSVVRAPPSGETASAGMVKVCNEVLRR